MKLMGPERLPKGPAVRLMLEEQLEWQLRHPDGSREEVFAYLHAKIPRQHASLIKKTSEI